MRFQKFDFLPVLKISRKMSIYQSKCERFICSPIASGLTAILSLAYFVSNPTLSSLFLTTIVVRFVDLLQKRLLKYDLERFKNFARPVVEDDHEEQEEPQEEPQEEEEEQQEEQEEQEEQEGQEEQEEQEEANDGDEEYIPSHKPNLKRRTYNLRNRMD